jgi:hypothetical protein
MDADPDVWPANLPPLVAAGGIEEGLRVFSISGRIEGRTTGSRRRCSSTGCPGWFIGVRWETGQLMFICSQGWRWHPAARVVRVHSGGEISARYVSPKPLGTRPIPEDQWPERSALRKWAGWRV